MTRKPWRKTPKALFWLLVAAGLALAYARPGRAADTVTVNARCNGIPPCLSWSFDLPSVPTLSPALYVTGYDFDGLAEGTLTLNGHTLPLFGPEASPSFDRQITTIGYATDASWWQAGPGNLGVIVWTTDPANDPTKHRIDSISVQYAPVAEWVGPVVCLRKGNPARLLYGFRNTSTGVRTAHAVVYSAAIDVRLRFFLAQFRAGLSAGPLDLTGGLIKAEIQPGEIAMLWSTAPPGCAAP